MTVRKRSRIWTQQPQVGAEVDENYRDGLILCLHAPTLRDISGVKNDLTYTLSANLERVVGLAGRGVLHQNSSPTIYYANAGRLISNAKYLTISCVFQKHLSDKKFLVFAGWGAPYQALCQVNVDGSILWGVYQDSGNILLKITAAGVIQTGRVHSIVAAFEAGAISCFVDGVNIPLITDGWVAGSPTQIADNQTQHLNIGGYYDGDWFAGTIFHLAAWTRQGLPKQKLSENPWQICAPQTRRRLISAGAGGPTAYTLDSQPGSVSVVGSAATLKAARKLSASPGAVSIVGASATLKRSLKLSASAGAVAITGAAASLKVTRKLSANAGAVTIAGATAELVYTAVGASPVLNAESGSIAISGATATLKATRKLSADAGSITIVGASATMVKYFAGLSLNAQPGAVTIAGAVAGFRRTYKFIALPGSVAITGATASMVYTGATGQYTRAPSGAGPTVIQPGSYRPSNTGGRRY